MSKIQLLDCTLRDGGYINDWNFGLSATKDIIKKLDQSNMDIIEVGFLKKEEYSLERTIFNSVRQAAKLMPENKNCRHYALMVEVINPLEVHTLDNASDDITIIRVIVWKRLLKEGFDYCKGIVEKGYKLCVQPARVDQYSEKEFIDMLKMFSGLNPMAIYVVDSWGTMFSNEILKYIKLADKYLDTNVAIGYHGHNNMMQVLETTIDFLNLEMEHDKIIDASVYGIGRGAGNLNTEIVAEYLNRNHNTNYDILPLLQIYEKYVEPISRKMPWGYSIPYFLSAFYKCNPNYASYYSISLGMNCTDINEIIKMIPVQERIIYSVHKAEYYLKKWRGDQL